MKMQRFFDYEADHIPNAGYPLFGAVHIFIIMLCVIFIILSIIIYSKISESRMGKSMCRIYAILPVLLIIAREIYAVAHHAPIIYELPLHLCSLTGFICLIFEYVPDSFFRSLLGQTLYALCLPGALMAILFPDGTAYPPIHFITFESHLFHALIVAYICMRIADNNIRPSIRDVYKCIIFLFVIVPLILLFDRGVNTNYMYLLHPSKGSPLTGFYTTYGYDGYLIGFGCVVLIVIILMNILGMLVDCLIKKKRRETPF